MGRALVPSMMTVPKSFFMYYIGICILRWAHCLVSRRLVASGYEVVGALFIPWLISLYFDDSRESTILSVLHGSL
jgi:hypothetical protein